MYLLISVPFIHFLFLSAEQKIGLQKRFYEPSVVWGFIIQSHFNLCVFCFFVAGLPASGAGVPDPAGAHQQTVPSSGPGEPHRLLLPTQGYGA